MTRPGLSPIERVWLKVDRSDAAGCWPFIGAGTRRPAGHGRIKVSAPGERLRCAQVHRVVYESLHGPIPDGMVVRHACDNPPCCRPDHLLIGTQHDNVRDMHERGRAGHGELRGAAHPLARLTDAQVTEIRASRAQGALIRELAERYGIGTSQVSRICRGMSRADVAREPVYPPAVPVPACGTPPGYHAHRKRGEPACARCKAAVAAQERERYARRHDLLGEPLCDLPAAHRASIGKQREEMGR